MTPLITEKHKSFNTLITTSLLLLLFQTGFTQFSVLKNFTVSDGLPSSMIYDMLQDSVGHIWFATENGVSRFDGYEFRNYSTDDGFPSNSIIGIAQDVKNRLWVFPYDGGLYYVENDSVHRHWLSYFIANLNIPFFTNIILSNREAYYATPYNSGMLVFSEN